MTLPSEARLPVFTDIKELVLISFDTLKSLLFENKLLKCGIGKMGCSSNGFTVMVQSISEIGFQGRNYSSLSMSVQGLPSHCGHPLQLRDTKGRGGSLGGKLFLIALFPLSLR